MYNVNLINCDNFEKKKLDKKGFTGVNIWQFQTRGNGQD
jgi:hypothetical protein